MLPGATSAEALAQWLFARAREVLSDEVAARLTAVRVSETPKTWAEYAPSAR